MCTEMDNKQKITLCRLCFNSCDGAFVNVNDFRRKILAILFPQSKVKVSSVLCENCARCLLTLFAFKSNCLYLEEYINSFMDNDDNVKVDLKDIYLNMNNCKSEVNTREGCTVCRLCVKLSDTNCMLLNENEKDKKSIKVMVQMCIPELDLSITKDPVICNSCYACVCNYFRFHKSYSNLEQMLKKYGEFGGTCGKNQIKQPTNELEFSGSNIINYKCNFIDDNQHEKKEDSRVMFNYENRIAIELPELDIKNEEVDIKMDEEMIGENVLGYKSDHINTNGSNACRENENSEIAIKYENIEINERADVELSPENASSCKTKYSGTPVNFYEDETSDKIKLKILGEKNTRTLNITLENTEVQSEGARLEDSMLSPTDASAVTVCHYNRSKFGTESLHNLKKLELLHQDAPKVALDQCGQYCYETECENTLDLHVRFHTANLNVKMHQCDVCLYETRHKSTLIRHKLIHKSTSEVTMYSCGICEYKGIRKDRLKEHMLIHKNGSEVTMYQCEICPYETKQKHHLKRHMLVHKDASEVTMYSCDMCTYKAKRRQNLKKHMLVHRSNSEVNIYACEMCTYKTKRNESLKKHMLIHSNISEVKTYSCEICAYKSKEESNLRNHMLIHKNASKVTIYTCQICTFTSTHIRSLKRHMSIHNNASEVTMYTCTMCTFTSKYISSLRAHMLTHKNASEVTMFQCEMCTHQAKRKPDLKRHMLTHRSASEVEAYSCALCTYKAKQKGCLARHMVVHQNASKAKSYSCEICTYTSKDRSNFNRHMLIHKDSSEVTVYHCDACAFNTKYKNYLKRHMLTHKILLKRKCNIEKDLF